MQAERESLPDSLMRSAVNDYTADALLHAGESLFDTATQSALDNDVLMKVPVLGILAGLTKGLVTFRDRRYANKILNFLAVTSRATDEERARYRAKLDANPEEAKRAGETILDIIDKITTNEKAVMIGKVFRAYMSEHDMTLGQVIYLSEIIERAYLQDLMSLQKSEVHSEANLENIGLKEPLRTSHVQALVEESIKAYESHKDDESRLARTRMSSAAVRLPKLVEPQWTDAGRQLVRILRSYD